MRHRDDQCESVTEERSELITIIDTLPFSETVSWSEGFLFGSKIEASEFGNELLHEARGWRVERTGAKNSIVTLISTINPNSVSLLALNWIRLSHVRTPEKVSSPKKNFRNSGTVFYKKNRIISTALPPTQSWRSPDNNRLQRLTSNQLK